MIKIDIALIEDNFLLLIYLGYLKYSLT